MEQHYARYTDSVVAGAIATLHTLLESDLPAPDPGAMLAQIRRVAQASGGEMLFELPADHPNFGEMQWAVLRFAGSGGETFVHVFFSPTDARFWIGENDLAPDDFARFAQAWTDMLTLCLNDLPDPAPDPAGERSALQ